MTPDELREKVRAAIEAKAPVEMVCPRCGGEGRVVASKPIITQDQLAREIGTTRTGVSTFLAGRQTFGMAVTLRLLDWLAVSEEGSLPPANPSLLSDIEKPTVQRNEREPR